MAMLRPTKRAAASAGAVRPSSSLPATDDQSEHEEEDRRSLLHQKGSAHRHYTTSPSSCTVKRICKSLCLLIILLLISFPLLMKLDRANPAGLRVQKSIAAHNNHNHEKKTRVNITNHCEIPSLPSNNGMHIVIGGYRRNEPGFEMTDKFNYLGDIGLTNAHVYWYRRIQPEIPQAVATLMGDNSNQHGCGMIMHERYLAVNHGRDPAAFYHHLLQVYDDPPGAVVFLHGHGAKAWHTSCDALFARTIAYYRDLAEAFEEGKKLKNNNKGSTQQEYSVASLVNSTQKRLSNHMMTLTSSAQGTKNYVHKWFGKSAWKVQLQLDTPESPIVSAPYYLPSHYSPAYYQSENKPCRDLLDKWVDVIPSHTTSNPYMSTSCCASFIVPGHRIHRYPRELYQDLFDLLTNPTNDDLVVGRFCFEYLVYDLFHDDGLFEFEEVVKLYDEADALIHGKRGGGVSTDRVVKDESVVERLGNCLAS